MTREEAINLLADMDSDKYTAKEAVALTMAIKALEQMHDEENVEAWNKRPADQKPQPKGTRLDGLIADAAATLDHLRLLRDILNTGDCNECKNKDCQHKPIVGERVRYNCYDFKK